MSSKTTLFATLLISLALSVQGQDMYNNLINFHEKFHPAAGVMMNGFPNGVELQLYQGGICGTRGRLNSYQKLAVISAYIGNEGQSITNTTVLKEGEPAKGGLRFGARYLHPFLTLISPNIQTYIGAGLESGYHNFSTPGNIVNRTNLATGITVPLGLEFFIVHGTINRDQVVLLTAFVEGKYYKEFGNKYFYFKPSFGVRVNLFG